MPLTRDDVQRSLGDLSDDLVERILAMGLTGDDLAQVAREVQAAAGEDEPIDEALIEELCLLVRDDAGEEVWAEVGPDY